MIFEKIDLVGVKNLPKKVVKLYMRALNKDEMFRQCNACSVRLSGDAIVL